MYASTILADSIGAHGVRLTTLEVVFPRPYLAEFNTHRRLSRNSASSRAIPVELRIERVMKTPYIPEFRERVKGMGGGAFLTGARKTRAQCAWLEARDDSVMAARKLLNVAKDDAARLIEPFDWQTVIVSATEWQNFLNLRDHEDAAIPMQKIARLMRESLMFNEPKPLAYGEWHLPLVGHFENTLIAGYAPDHFGAKVSAGRCARSSYETQHDPETPNNSADRWEGLAGKGHWSPGEHPAMCVETTDGSDFGNFDPGWLQLRKLYGGEAVFSG